MNPFTKVRMYIKRKFAFGADPTKRIISFWQKGGADFNYFQAAENAEWLKMFWSDGSPFAQTFHQLDLRTTLELACGAGRHSFQGIDRIGELYLLDSSAGALDLAKDKFREYPNVRFIHNPDGLGIRAGLIPDGSLSAVFSYDAMVHFEKEVVFSYVRDCYRLLQPGGLCLLHYSNYQGNPGGKFTDNPGWRNYMSQELFVACAIDTGFTILHTSILDFSGPATDALTLMKK